MSFKRKSTSKTQSLPGTRPSPGSIATTITSTGIPSLDDILGGGLPLSCSLVIAAPDPHSAYGELVQKFFVSQGLACKQDVLVVGSNLDALDWVKSCMWFHNPTSSKTTLEDDVEEQKPADEDQKMKIAWRYEQLKQFQTTVGSTSYVISEDFCQPFDLTSRIPLSIIDSALKSSQLTTFNVLDVLHSVLPNSFSTTQKVLLHIEEILSQRSSRAPKVPLRICIPALGSYAWGDLCAQDILHFLYRLRSVLSRHPLSCASISMESHISANAWGGPGWIEKVGWMCDGLITLDAFTTNPSLSTLFPSHHGLVHIHTLPSPHTLLPPSDRFSTLRGLSVSAVEGGNSSGENNLAFKCTRKRLIFETLHLDVEGGVGERRTTPAPSTAFDNDTHISGPTAALPAVEVEVEVDRGSEVKASFSLSQSDTEVNPQAEVAQVPKSRSKKPKKAVAFRSDRPDLYDF
ncbi:Elongator complex protein 4 [Lentinula raphanica]|nr:Elongator complex protein 4 [Lentinula raphanica]